MREVTLKEARLVAPTSTRAVTLSVLPTMVESAGNRKVKPCTIPTTTGNLSSRPGAKAPSTHGSATAKGRLPASASPFALKTYSGS